MWQDERLSWLRSTLRDDRIVRDTEEVCQTRSAPPSTKVEISGVKRVAFVFKD